MEPIKIARMAPSEIGRIAELDRSEHIAREYIYRDGKLETRDLDIHVSPWFTDGRPGHSVQAKMAEWLELLAKGGTMLGAFEGSQLVGVGIYYPHLTMEMAQLAVLHVSATYRGRGIGAALSHEIEQLARADGFKKLYVSATPSLHTVDFYRCQGFELAEEVNEELYRLEPDDIHLVKVL